MERIDLFFYKLRYVTGGLLMIAGLLLAIGLLSFISHEPLHAKNAGSSSFQGMHATDSPNAVTNGMVAAGAELEQATSSMAYTLKSSAGSTSLAANHIGTFIAGSGRFIAHGVESGAAWTGRGIGSGAALAARGVGSSVAFIGETASRGLVFVLRIPLNTVGFITESAVARAVIQPANHAPVPIIKPHSTAEFKKGAALAAVKPAHQTAEHNDSKAEWPVRGAITTMFGVPHWPYQPVHTGMDISTGRAPGIAPIKPFKAGRVIETVYSNYGLGNHVIVDHGEGLSSVYAHLTSISVKVGQGVDGATVLGFEGSTGMSTGTHLHFEIRLHGRPVNPQQYLSGHP